MLSQLRNECQLLLTLHEGHKRQVRRMLSVVGHPVVQLARVGVGQLSLGDTPVGKWRYLSPTEVETLIST